METATTVNFWYTCPFTGSKLERRIERGHGPYEYEHPELGTILVGRKYLLAMFNLIDSGHINNWRVTSASLVGEHLRRLHSQGKDLPCVTDEMVEELLPNSGVVK